MTVGLQGGGAIYSPEVMDRYDNSAFAPDGSLKPAYMERLRRVLAVADEVGMGADVAGHYAVPGQHVSEDRQGRFWTEALVGGTKVGEHFRPAIGQSREVPFMAGSRQRQ